MKIYFTIEASMEVMNKIGIITEFEPQIQSYFEDKYYSEDLEHLYIALFCMSDNFATFFTPRKPKYTPDTKIIINMGIEVEKKAKTLEYEVRLDFKIYNELPDVRQQLANDIISSLDKLSPVKKIKHLDLQRFKEDFIHYFKDLKWIE